MSGEMNTSVGNGWGNLCIFAYICEELKGEVWDGYVEGDDGIFGTNAEITARDYELLGFDVKVVCLDCSCPNPETHPPADGVAFCGIIAATDGTLLKSYTRVFQNFGWTTSCLDAGEDVMHELLRAKALSLAYEVGHCPILWALAKYTLENTRDYAPRFIRDGYHDTDLIPRDERFIPLGPPSIESRVDYQRHFGLTPGLQEEVESMILQGKFDTVANIIPAPLVQQDYERRFVG